MATSTKTVRLTIPAAAAQHIGYRAELRACINALNPGREGDLCCISCVSSWPAPRTCSETVFQPLISQQFLKLPGKPSDAFSFVKPLGFRWVSGVARLLVVS